MSNVGKPKLKDIPFWQRQESSDTPTPADNEQFHKSNGGTSTQKRASLLEKAAKFLEDDDIQNAPIERKRYFLQSKGLTEEEIMDLLQTQDIPEAELAKGFEEEQQDASPLEPSKPRSNTTVEQPSGTPPKDTPPIITYPEFLVHSQKPPPLITAQRLMTTIYLASSAAAAIYGTSKYIVEPMVETLIAARHSLFDTASMNLSTLNDNLEKSVSKIPGTTLNPDDSGPDSIDSDPSRFFTRSAATQTSSYLSRSTSSVSETPASLYSPISAHQARLSTIHKRLSDLLPPNAQAPSPLKDSLDELRKCLDELTYSDTVKWNGKGDKGKEDVVAKVRSEIRSVKGVLLNARNFPSGVSLR